ncbi:serine-threonine protein kinase, plant-type, putative [Ricinus communis]|uniref:Serine-threonine protein kinase, plant-type, putative n=1 Tax=Ricinus communis TaxID=3988 RepID=B9RGT9_RICCO|nr:serine-threonine protein kinase, plant-type, putative [Ricinus communis]
MALWMELISFLPGENKKIAVIGEELFATKKSGHVYGLNLRPRILNPSPAGFSFMPFRGEISSSITKLRYLIPLDLSLFSGSGNSIQQFIGSLKNLRYLNFSGCFFSWKNPVQFVTRLVSLDLSESSFHKLNLLQDPPDAFGAVIALRHLDLSYNGIEGEIPRSFGNLYTLKTLDLSRTYLSGNFPDMINVSFIRELHLSMNKVHWSLSESIGQLSNLEVLDLSSNSMGGVISDIHFSNLSKLWKLDISDHSYTLAFSSNWNPLFQLIILKMRSCILGPRFPQWLHRQKRIIHLDISNTSISDRISDWFWELPPTLRYLNLSYNLISGEVQKLPLILGNFSVIDMSSNNFHGSIPLLRPDITLLNLAKNRLSGTISNLCSISGNLPQLKVLRLRSNRFYGTIFLQLCHPAHIQILDFSRNNISGSIPQCVSNFTTMVQEGGTSIVAYTQNIILAWKGIELEYGQTLRFVKCIDISTGTIPRRIGYLNSLESLDLSASHLSGGHPDSLSDLNFLSYINLSDNKLQGKIPMRTQMQSFNGTSFEGNARLCGKPLPNRCPREQSDNPSVDGDSKVVMEDGKDEIITSGFYISMGVGFGTAFWAVCGTLLLYRPGRHATFGSWTWWDVG